ncbi:hypothetical protein J4461_04505 [Candidatus Pacearchaeota archaeon]|nr:hypothetical protein [Candidatus Pacearchaeota archaeon]
MSVKELITYIATGVVSIMAYNGISYLDGKQPFNTIPRANTIQAEYVVPNKLEIKLIDLEGDGQRETIIRYDETNYLFKLDEKGVPLAEAYEVRPPKVIPKK